MRRFGAGARRKARMRATVTARPNGGSAVELRPSSLRSSENERLQALKDWLAADPSYIPDIEVWCSVMRYKSVEECVDIIRIAIEAGCQSDFIQELYNNSQEPLWYAVGDLTMLKIHAQAGRQNDY